MQRDYAALFHARGALEDKGITKLRMLLFDVRLWHVLPQVDMSNDLKVKCFLSITGSEALTEKLLAIPHSMAPHIVLLTLEQPELIDRVCAIRICLLDAWSRDFLAHNDLRTSEAKLKLLIIVILWRDNTNLLEVTNAQLRRFVKKKTQTTQLDTSQLSEKYMGLQLRYGHLLGADARSGEAASGAAEQTSNMNDGRGS